MRLMKKTEPAGAVLSGEDIAHLVATMVDAAVERRVADEVNSRIAEIQAGAAEAVWKMLPRWLTHTIWDSNGLARALIDKSLDGVTATLDDAWEHPRFYRDGQEVRVPESAVASVAASCVAALKSDPFERAYSVARVVADDALGTSARAHDFRVTVARVLIEMGRRQEV